MSSIINRGDNIFEGIPIDFTFADSSFANNSNSILGLPSLSEPIHGQQDSLVDVGNENKRVRNSRAKHTRVHSDPNVLARFVSEMGSSSTTTMRTTTFPVVPIVEDGQLPETLPISINSDHAKMKGSPSMPPRVPRDNVLDGEGMDDFLNMFSMPELPAIGENNDDFFKRNEKIKQEVESMKTKRKRGGSHQRSISNPVGLLHNLDQIRQMAEEAKANRRAMHPPSSIATTIPEVENGLSEPMFESEMIDMDMDLQGLDDLTEDQKNLRRQYKCGRCGKPKVGHVCTAPEQRNNFTQVDLGLTTGTKPAELPYKVLPVKTVWVPMHEDYV